MVCCKSVFTPVFLPILSLSSTHADCHWNSFQLFTFHDHEQALLSCELFFIKSIIFRMFRSDRWTNWCTSFVTTRCVLIIKLARLQAMKHELQHENSYQAKIDLKFIEKISESNRRFHNVFIVEWISFQCLAVVLSEGQSVCAPPIYAIIVRGLRIFIHYNILSGAMHRCHLDTVSNADSAHFLIGN